MMMMIRVVVMLTSYRYRCGMVVPRGKGETQESGEGRGRCSIPPRAVGFVCARCDVSGRDLVSWRIGRVEKRWRSYLVMYTVASAGISYVSRSWFGYGSLEA